MVNSAMICIGKCDADWPYCLEIHQTAVDVDLISKYKLEHSFYNLFLDTIIGESIKAHQVIALSLSQQSTTQSG